MNTVLSTWNQLGESEAREAMLACCGARRWAGAMVALRPFVSEDELRAAADRVWATMEEPDWLEAFACHPRIGERTGGQASTQSERWSRMEQANAETATELILAEIAAGNGRYEEKFGFTYIVCATGRSAGEMLTILNRRLLSDRESELREAAEQQRMILQIRLGKWLSA